MGLLGQSKTPALPGELSGGMQETGELRSRHIEYPSQSSGQHPRCSCVVNEPPASIRWPAPAIEDLIRHHQRMAAGLLGIYIYIYKPR